MRRHVLALIAVVGLAAPAMAQGVNNGSVPTEIGNRANGLDYQPTLNEIVPREKAAGIRPSIAQERAANEDLVRIDKDLLLSEGMSTESIPKLTNGQ